jgi:hypothetical protein
LEADHRQLYMESTNTWHSFGTALHFRGGTWIKGAAVCVSQVGMSKGVREGEQSAGVVVLRRGALRGRGPRPAMKKGE